MTAVTLSRFGSANIGRFLDACFGRWLFREDLFTRQIELLAVWQLQRRAGASGGRIPTWTSDRELLTLYYLASRCPAGATGLEIGSYLGASTCSLALGLGRNNGRLYCVDTWLNETMPEGERDTFSDFKANTAKIAQYLTPIRKRSDEIADIDLRLPLHLVFIDADHSYLAVKQDFARIAPWVSDAGTVIFHDGNAVDHQGVSRLVGEVLACGEWVLAGNVDTLIWINRNRPS
jgi:predicted O-methyltransferase YrrM